jgi:hypothetical protein
VLPIGTKPSAVRFASPETPELAALQHTSKAGRIQFVVPGFLVYGVVQVELQRSE